MANIAVVVDEDGPRRDAFMRALLPRLAPVDDLVTGTCSAGSFSAAWSAGAHAPVDFALAGRSAAVVWGDVLEEDGRRVTAASLRRARFVTGGERQAWDGFHAAVAYTADPVGRVLLNADILGLFPLYYHATPELLLAGSSPICIAGHPSFAPSLDEEGLAGVLLTGGAVHGRTLWSGVQRLAPGYVLDWQRGRGAVEVCAWEVPQQPADPARTPHERVLVALVEERLRGWVDRLPPRRHALLLSGGRDSRVIAGALASGGVPMRCLTMGRADDAEAICAAGVARATCWEHDVVDTDCTTLPDHMDRTVRVEHLIGHVAGSYAWDTLRPLRQSGAEGVISGHLLEAVIGGVHLAWSQPGPQAQTAGEVPPFLRHVYRHGVPPAQLDTLFRKDRFAGLAESAATQVRRIHDECAATPGERALRFIFRHWARHHPGAVPWRLSFAAWPSVPVLDRAFMRLISELPASALTGRALQDALLRRCYRPIARVPFERGAGVRPPLVQPWLSRLGRARYRTRDTAGWYYGRIYDTDSEWWRETRRRADPLRDRVADIFEPSALNAFLPAAGERWDLTDPIIDSFGPKTLLGFLLWHNAH
jgi:asparagine synthase (glutamine-hydrolysing)